MDNMTKIAPGIYLVRTQAGFKQALKTEFADAFGQADWQDAVKHLTGYPRSYPAVVSLSVGYRGYHYFHCNSVPVNTLKSVIENA